MSDPILQQALARLPQYSPPPGIWEELEAALDAEAHLSQAVRELPHYAPPPVIWDQIEAQLPPQRGLQARWSPRIWMAAAAALLLLLAATRWLLTPQPVAPEPVVALQETLPKAPAEALIPETPTTKPIATKPVSPARAKTPAPQETVTVAQETVDSRLMEACRESDNDALALIDGLCREQAPVCDLPEFKTLKTELDELTLAEHELREAIGQYADDPELVAELVRLERARDAVLQQLVQFI